MADVSERFQQLSPHEKSYYEQQARQSYDEYMEQKKKLIRPATPYAKFLKANYSRVQAEYPDAVFADLARKVSELWKEVSEFDKARMKEEYQHEMKRFQERLNETDE